MSQSGTPHNNTNSAANSTTGNGGHHGGGPTPVSQQQRHQQGQAQSQGPNATSAALSASSASNRSTQNTSKDFKKMKASTVTDSTAANSRQLLNAYVYDFLIKSSLPNTAKAFYQEADVPIADSNETQQQNTSKFSSTASMDLPPLSISMDAPQGFLYEWWQIFWDVFNARTHRVGSAAAQQYFQLHALKQRQEHALHGLTAQAAQAQAQAQAQQQAIQAQAQAQAQQHPQHQQQQLNAGPVAAGSLGSSLGGVPAPNAPPLPNQPIAGAFGTALSPGGSSIPSHMIDAANAKRQGNMNLAARLQQEHAQRQMNNLRQRQAAQAALNQGQSQTQGQAVAAAAQTPGNTTIQSPSKRARAGVGADSDGSHSNGNTPTHIHNIPQNASQSPHSLQNQIPAQGMMIPNHFNPQLAAAIFAQQQQQQQQQHLQQPPKQMTSQQYMAAAAAAAARGGNFNQAQLAQMAPNQAAMLFNQQRVAGREFMNEQFPGNNMMVPTGAANGAASTTGQPGQGTQQPQPQPQPQMGSHKTPQMGAQASFRQPPSIAQQSPSAKVQQLQPQQQNGSTATEGPQKTRNSLLGLQDYQMQLIAIERSNKKKMEDVRDANGLEVKPDPANPATGSDFNNMFSNQLQQQMQAQAKWNQTQNLASNDNAAMPPPQLSRGTPVSSPAVSGPNNKTTPGAGSNAATSSAPKKKAAPRARKKKSVAGTNNNASEPATPTTPATPANSAAGNTGMAPTPHTAINTSATNGTKRGTKRKESTKDTTTAESKKDALTPASIASTSKTTTAINNNQTAAAGASTTNGTGPTTNTADAASNSENNSNQDTSPHTAVNQNTGRANSNDLDANMLNDYQQFNADTFGTGSESHFLSDFNTGNNGDDMALDLNVFLDTEADNNSGNCMFNWGNVTES